MIATFGIDKLGLSNTDFIISSSLHLNIQPNVKRAGDSESAQSLLFMVPDDNGEPQPQYGQKAFINSDLYQAEFYTGGLMTIRLNPSKIYGSLTCDSNVLKDTVKQAVTHLAKHGVYVNPETFEIVRADFTRDAEMEYTHPEYLPLFNKKRLNTKSIEYTDGIRFGSGSTKTSAVIYDKGKKEMIDKYGRRKAMPSTKKVRTEANANRKGISDFFPSRKLIELYNADERHLKNVYLKIIKSNIDVFQTSAEFTDVTTVIDAMKIYKASKRKHWFEEFMVAIALENENIPNSVVYQAIDLCNFPKSTKSEMKDKYKRIMETATFMRSRLNQQSQEMKISKQLEYNEKFIFSMAI